MYNVEEFQSWMPCYSSSRQAVGLSPLQPPFIPSPVCVRFVAHGTTLGQVSVCATQFSAVIITAPVLHNHLNTAVFFRRTRGRRLGAFKQRILFRTSQIFGQQSTAALFLQSSDFQILFLIVLSFRCSGCTAWRWGSHCVQRRIYVLPKYDICLCGVLHVAACLTSTVFWFKLWQL